MDNFSQTIKNQIENTVERLENLRRGDSLVLALFSDIHVSDICEERVNRLCETLKLISAKLRPDAVVDLGDNPGMLGRTKHISNSDLKYFFESLLTKIHSAAAVPLICVNGNHDAIGTDFFDADFWNAIVKGKFGVESAVYGNGSYFYIDYPKSKTRIVVLSVPSGSDLDAKMPTPLWCFGNEQIEWLTSTAIKTDNDIILLCHTPPYDKYTGNIESTLATWDGEKERVSTIAALCGWTDDADVVAKALKSHFDSSENRLLGIFSGHAHFDSIWQPLESRGPFTNQLDCTQVVIKSPQNEKGYTDFIGMAVDIAVWTPSKNEFNIIRIGDGEDREITIK